MKNKGGANGNADWQTTPGCKVVPGADAMSEYAIACSACSNPVVLRGVSS